MQTSLRLYLTRNALQPLAVTGLPLLLLFTGLAPSKAVLVSNSNGFSSPISFNFADQPPGNTYTSGPVLVGASTGETIILTGTPNDEIEDKPVISTPAPPDPQSPRRYDVGDNGKWEDPLSWAGTHAEKNFIDFSFTSGPVSAAGAFMNYAPDYGGATISAYDNQGNLLESYDLAATAPINTPDKKNAGDFRGILRQTLDISRLRFSNAYAVVSQITFSHGSKPNPPALKVPGPLPALGLACAWGWARRLRRQRRLDPAWLNAARAN
jgi:hypothetical protein